MQSDVSGLFIGGGLFNVTSLRYFDKCCLEKSGFNSSRSWFQPHQGCLSAVVGSLILLLLVFQDSTVTFNRSLAQPKRKPIIMQHTSALCTSHYRKMRRKSEAKHDIENTRAVFYQSKTALQRGRLVIQNHPDASGLGKN